MHKRKLFHILRNINNLSIFNTSYWPKKELLIRLIACIVIITFLLFRIPHHRYQNILLQNTLQLINKVENFSFVHLINTYLKFIVIFLEDFILITYLIAYIFRIHARNNAQNFMETFYPFLIAYLPLIISFLPYNTSIGFSETNYNLLQNIIFISIIIGYTINVISVWTIRKSFAVMIEARYLIKKGIYRFIRHPAYSSQFIIFGGLMLLHFSPLSFILYILFIVGQIHRATLEEKKLIETFPDYITYKKKTGMFFPKLNSFS